MRFALACAFAFISSGASKGEEGLEKIKTIVVIYAENRSFDHLYGFFPGANGIANATVEQSTQLDHDGTPLPFLTIFAADGKPDPRFPRMPNAPFRIDAPPINLGLDKITPSPVHAFFQNQEQINDGKNNMFAAISNVGGWVMGNFDGSRLRMWQWARDYVLADNFFMGAFGGSFLNHLWLICACTPTFPGAPEAMRTRLEVDGRLAKRLGSPSAREAAVQLLSPGTSGQLTPDGFAVNTMQPPYQPSGIPPEAGGDANLADPGGTPQRGLPLPPQAEKTIGDTMSDKGVTWAWYAGGWNLALSDGRQPPTEPRKVIYSKTGGEFQPHHQPFNYFARFAPGTADRATHLKDEEDLLRDVDAGTLPQVSFYKPMGHFNQHPSYTDLVSGDIHITDLLDRLRNSPQWSGMAVIITYDENGGFWDHVPPPRGAGWADRWGPGSRIPTMIASPYARRGFVDKTSYDTTSIIKFITRRFGLAPLPGVRPFTGDLTGAFDFGH
jgi:phospholipase C